MIQGTTRIASLNRIIGEYLKSERMSAGLSANGVARTLNVSVNKLLQYEAGRASPSGCLFLKLLELYQSDFDAANEVLNKASFAPPFF